jgi:hypothetical protein
MRSAAARKPACASIVVFTSALKRTSFGALQSALMSHAPVQGRIGEARLTDQFLARASARALVSSPIGEAAQPRSTNPKSGPSNRSGASDIGKHSNLVTFSLTYVPFSGIKASANLAHFRGRPTGDSRWMERVRFLRAGLVTPFSGGPGIGPSGITTGVRGAPLKRD